MGDKKISLSRIQAKESGEDRFTLSSCSPYLFDAGLTTITKTAGQAKVPSSSILAALGSARKSTGDPDVVEYHLSLNWCLPWVYRAKKLER